MLNTATFCFRYVPVFTIQDGLVGAYGRRLEEIANSSEADCAAYLADGDRMLSAPSMRRGRAGYTYVGTFFEDLVWPEWLTGMAAPSTGSFFLWTRIRST